MNRQDANFLARGSSNPGSQEQNLEQCGYRTSDNEITSVGPERPLVGENRTMRDNIKDHVILFSILGKVFLRVINNMVCTKRAHKVQLASVIHPGHFSPV